MIPIASEKVNINVALGQLCVCFAKKNTLLSISVDKSGKPGSFISAMVKQPGKGQYFDRYVFFAANLPRALAKQTLNGN